jgi:hypothetical protein
MKFRWMLVPLLVCAHEARSLEFSKEEWDNPGQAGSSIWLRNEKAAPIRIESLFIRDNGIRKFDEVAMEMGTAKLSFAVEKGRHGHWARLVPSGKKPFKIRIGARDSLFVRGFQYGNRLKAKNRKILAEEYVLDLKLVDNTGDSSVVKVSESASHYYIGGNAGWADSGPEAD